MKTNIFRMSALKNKFLLLAAASMLTLASCIDTTEPTDVLTEEQVKGLAASQEGMLNGIVSYLITYNSWGLSGDYLNDWGYPCQMFFREILGSDIPVYSSNYSYWYSIEAGTETRYAPYYTYRFYYNLIKCCNNLIGVVDPEDCSTLSRQYLGCALAFRAMAYFDIARMYEYKRTGVASVDSKADELGCWNLTIPIVTEEMNTEEIKQTPRAKFTEMYRFILTDLNNAEKYIDGFSRSAKTLPDKTVVYGLKARFWLELGSRFEQKSEDLEAVIAYDSEDNGYDKIGVTSARQCYEYARDYARRAASGYSPVTAAQWHDRETGFNTPNQAWMWCMSYSTKEQLGYDYCSFQGTMFNEPDWGMGRGYKAFRMIGSSLYNRLEPTDWRRWSWIDPASAGTSAGYKAYSSQEINGTTIALTNLSEEEWKELPAYANTKFRYGKNGKSDYEIGCLVDLPLMRVEEMNFIDIECTAYLEGMAAGVKALTQFINTYRVTDGSYDARSPSSMYLFISQLMTQKRIEFWGEGITYFDMKRLNQQVRRSDNTNYEDAYLLDSVDGYCAPWMNYFILEYELNMNPNIVPNPDTSSCIAATQR
ncbi:MAG: RagB/SusD family nutrient uptake outer membrane protein [Muribaculaceae bacterium]